MAIMLLAFPALRNQANAIDIQATPPSTGYHFALTESSQRKYIPEKGPWLINLQYQYASSPLVQWDAFGTSKTVLVQSLQTVDLNTGYTFSRKFYLGANSSINNIKTRDGNSRFSAADTRISSKWMFPEYNWGQTAIQTFVTLPTGNEAYFLSNAGIGYGARLILQKDFGPLLLALNAGMIYSTQSKYKDLDLRKRYPVGTGAQLRFGKTLSLNVEASMTYLPTYGFSKGPGDLYIGPNINLWNTGVFSLGASLIGIERDNTANFRIIAGLKIFPFSKDDPQTKVVRVNVPVYIPGKVVRLPGCVNKTFERSFPARKIKRTEQTVASLLPYNSTAGHGLALLNIGDGNAKTPNKTAYAEQAMVLFAVDLPNLPDKGQIMEINSAKLNIGIRQLSAANKAANPDLLCFLREKICSGEAYSKKNMAQNINKKFFGNKETPNDYFSREPLKQVLAQQGEKKILGGKLHLDLSRLVENTETTDITKLLYEYGAKTPSAFHTLYFVVAGDSFVEESATSIELKIKYNHCEKPEEPKK